MITGASDAAVAAADLRLSGRYGMTSNELLLGQKMNTGANLGRLDPPRHTAVRALLLPDFLPAAARRLEPHVRARVRGYLDELKEKLREKERRILEQKSETRREASQYATRLLREKRKLEAFVADLTSARSAPAE